MLIAGGQSILSQPFGIVILIEFDPTDLTGRAGLRGSWPTAGAYWFDEGRRPARAVRVVFHQERRMQLSRLQTVDVNRPLVARVFGFAALRIEVAGAGDSRADLQYLTVAEARCAAQRIIARSAGLEHDVGGPRNSRCWWFPTKDLLVSLLLRAATVFLLLATILIVVSTVWVSGWGGIFHRHPRWCAAADGLHRVQPVVQLLGRRIARWRASAARFAADPGPHHPAGQSVGGRVRRTALLAPPRMGQAVRHRGWVGQEDDDTGTESVLLPVAPRAVAEELFARIMPGTTPQDVQLQSPPVRVRRRSPIQWRHLAAGVDSQVAVLKRGRVTRRPRSCTTPVFSPCG